MTRSGFARFVLFALALLVALPASAQEFPAAGSRAGGGGFSFSRGGCATGGGCGAGGFWLIQDHIWANSPGVRHSTTGASFATGPIAGPGDSPNHNSEVLEIGRNLSFSNCDVPFAQFCKTIVNAFDGSEFASNDAEADPHFCRSNVAPYAACSTGADCVSSIAGPDDPETFIIRHNRLSLDETEVIGYTYAPVFVTGYSGCNSATNTLTVQPAKVGAAFTSSFWVQAGDQMQAAFNDNVHPGPFYGGFLAQNLMLATVGSSFEPKANLVGVNGNGDDEAACDDVGDSTGASNASTGATNAIPFDPTKAAYLGSWSAVTGGACVYTGAESDVVQLRAFPVTPGVYYTIRVRAGVNNSNALAVRVRDQANAQVNANWRIIARGDHTIPITSGFVSLNGEGSGGWNTFIARVQAPEGATSLRLELNYGSTSGNHYWDEYTAFPSVDPGPVDNYVIPPGKHKMLLVSDSRGSTAELAANIRAAAATLRPDVNLTLVEDSAYGRTLGSACTSGNGFCWNWAAGSDWLETGVAKPGRADALAEAGFDTAVVFLGVNDFTTVSGGIRPTALIGRIMEAVSAFQAAGIRVLWVKEPPVMGNSTFSAVNPVCRDSNGTTPLGCGRYVERVFRLLRYGGLVN